MARVSERIYPNINKSDISKKVGSITFYFTKDLNLKKFNDRLEDHIEREMYRLSSKSRVSFDADEYFAITLYTSIEKFGFRILIEGCEQECHDVSQVKLDGLIKTKSS